MECMICTEDLLMGSVGELDCCEHSFCSKCILKWAEKDSRCPACRGRFRSVTEKMLDREQPGLGCTDDEEMKHSKQMLGKAIKIHDIPERNQRPDMDDPAFYFSDAEDDPMNEVFCVECGGGEDEHNLLLCDGCDCACHTYCANLESIPEEEWFCHGCTEERERTNQGRLSAIIGNQQPGAAAAATPAPSRTPRRLTRAGVDGQGGRRRSTPGEVVDLITPEEPPVSPERSRRRLRRLYRRGPPAGGEGVEIGTTADFLAALEARAYSRTAGDAPSHAHRRLEQLRQGWGRIRQGQADFSSPVSLTAPHSNSASGQSSATQVSPDNGQPGGAAGQASASAQPSRRGRDGHGSDADAAFAALDDAMIDRRPCATRGAPRGAPSHGRGSETVMDASSFAAVSKRKREDGEDIEEQARPAIRQQARPLRRPQPRERSGSLQSRSRPSSGHAPTQARASAEAHRAGPPAPASPRSPFPAGSRHLQRVNSGFRNPSASQRSLHEHSSGHLHRMDSAVRPHRQGSGGSQGLSHTARPAQDLNRHVEANLSSVSQRQRAGALPRDSATPRQPSAHQHPQAPHGSHQWSGAPAIGPLTHEQRRTEPSDPMHHQYGQHAVPAPHPLHLGQHSLPFPRQGTPPTSEHAGRREAPHDANLAGLAYPLHAAQQHHLAASPNPPPLQQEPQQHTGGPAVPGSQESKLHPSSHITAPVSPDAAVQQLEAWYGSTSRGAQGMQPPVVGGGKSASSHNFGQRRGDSGLQSSKHAGLDCSRVPPSHGQAVQMQAAAPRLSEKEAVAAVKPLLKPLYAQDLLVRHQFKDAARRAVHLLSEGSIHNAQAAVKNALTSMGLELAASRLC